MSLEDNKRLVAEFNARFARSNIDAVLATMTADARWWVNGKPELSRVSGAITKAEFARINRETHRALLSTTWVRKIGFAQSQCICRPIDAGRIFRRYSDGLTF